MKLKAAREASGKTQAQVAKEAGITVRGYRKLEAKDEYKAIHTAIQIADILGVKSYKQFKQLFSARALDNKPDGNPGKDDTPSV